MDRFRVKHNVDSTPDSPCQLLCNLSCSLIRGQTFLSESVWPHKVVHASSVRQLETMQQVCACVHVHEPATLVLLVVFDFR